MSAPPATGPDVLKRRIAGVVFLVVIALLVELTVLLYQKAFTPVVKVSLRSDRIGNQLTVHSDVKLRGLVVGEVRSVTSQGDGAVIELALKPEDVKLIPRNVFAQLLPKTLFGEKYVDLIDPQVEEVHIRAGDTIEQDHSTTAVETERVLDDLLPLLRSLKPQDLSTTLDALATALRGRGDEVGAELVRTGAYLKALNPSLPTLAEDMQGLADLSGNVAEATPDLLAVLDNLSATSRNLVQEKPALAGFLTSTQGFAASAQSIVAQNADRLVALARDSKAPLDLFATYAPELPCLAKGLAVYEPIVEGSFGGLQAGLHINVELTTNTHGYSPVQTPKYRDARAPYCNGLPHPKVPEGTTFFDDGYAAPTTSPPAFRAAPSAFEQSRAVLNGITAPLLGLPARQVPDLVALLLGPVAQGNAVGLA